MWLIKLFNFIGYAIKNKSIKRVIEEFIEDCIYRDLSEETIGFYKQTLRFFYEFISTEKKFYFKKCYCITDKTIKRYVRYMKTTLNVQNSTINIRLKSLRALLNFCYKNNYMDKINVTLIKSNTLKIPYTDDEITKLIKLPDLTNCSVIQQFTRFRNWVLVNYFIATRSSLKVCH